MYRKGREVEKASTSRKPGLYLGMAAALTTAILWGSNHVVTRGMRDTIPLPSFVFWRWFIALVFLTVFARGEIWNSKAFILRNMGMLVFLGVVGVGLFSYLLIGSAFVSPAVEVGLLNATTPIWVVLIGILSGADKVRGLTWCGLLMALLGTAVVLTHADLGVLAYMSFGLGNLMTVAAAIIFAWFSIRIRLFSVQCSTLVLTVVTAWAGTLLVLLPAYVIALLYGSPALVAENADLPMALASLLYVAVLPTMIGNVLFLYGVKSIGPASTSIFMYFSPVFSAILAVVFLNEPLEWYHAAGFVIVVSGLLLVAMAGRAKALDAD